MIAGGKCHYLGTCHVDCQSSVTKALHIHNVGGVDRVDGHIREILNTATDIFPNIKIPIAAVIWRYNGILPEEIANRIVLFSERIAQTTVNDVEHTESLSVNGTAVVKYFFQPDVDQP